MDSTKRRDSDKTAGGWFGMEGFSNSLGSRLRATRPAGCCLVFKGFRGFKGFSEAARQGGRGEDKNEEVEKVEFLDFLDFGFKSFLAL